MVSNMKRISFAALALSVWFVPISQSSQQPSTGGIKKQGRADTQLAANSQDKQQAAEIATLNSILAAITKSEQERATESHQETSDEKETIKTEWWLVYVGIAQAIALIWTLVFIRYQAEKTAEATQVMRDSLPIQKNAADAALLNAQAVIGAARPWVSFFGSYDRGVFTCSAANLGNSPAEVISYASGMALTDRIENLPVQPNYGPPKVPPITFLIPGRTRDQANFPVENYNINNIPAPDPTKQIIVFFFSVVYKNPLAGGDSSIVLQHESRMCFWCSKTSGSFVQAGGGPQEYNRHT
jgi:hypothetical protein